MRFMQKLKKKTLVATGILLTPLLTIQADAQSIQQTFIDEVGIAAQELTQNTDIYASVMIAQAILESNYGQSGLGKAPNYNLFGVKGDYEGQSASMSTQEDHGDGTKYTIVAKFRKYPSYRESLVDYIDLISNGLQWNRNFYAGAWKSKTNSYKDATAYLQGRYATDTGYAKKLNEIIERYDLTRYDQKSAVEADLSLTKLLEYQSNHQGLSIRSLNTSVKDKDLNQLKALNKELDVVTAARERAEALKAYNERDVYRIPIKNARVTSYYGEHRSLILQDGTKLVDVHNGIDYVNGNSKAEIFAAKKGKVVYTGYHGGAGNTVVVQHEDGLYSYYAHLSVIHAKVGDNVDNESVLGIIGTTGYSTGIHLHFAMATDLWKGWVNPNQYLEG